MTNNPFVVEYLIPTKTENHGFLLSFSLITLNWIDIFEWNFVRMLSEKWAIDWVKKISKLATISKISIKKSIFFYRPRVKNWKFERKVFTDFFLNEHLQILSESLYFKFEVIWVIFSDSFAIFHFLLFLRPVGPV